VDLVRARRLLQPGWLGLTLVVLVFAGACFTLLAPWQFHRHEERQRTNEALGGSVGATPVAYESDLPQWRRVRLTGRYLPDAETVVRLRTVQGEPAFEVLTPLRLTDGRVVLVDRGFLRPERGVRVPAFPAAPPGEVTLVARMRTGETDPQRRPAFRDDTTDGHRQLYAIDTGIVAAATGLDLEPGYVALDDGQPGVLGALPLPQLDAGPFLSYALQWIAFGTMALLGWAYFSWRELRPGGTLAGSGPQAKPGTRPRRLSVAERIAEEEAREAGALPSGGRGEPAGTTR